MPVPENGQSLDNPVESADAPIAPIPPEGAYDGRTFSEYVRLATLLIAIVSVAFTAMTYFRPSSTDSQLANSGLSAMPLEERISRLSTEMQVDRFVSLLGEPLIKNESETWTEYVFVFPEAFVQAVTKPSGLVTMYTVTTRSPDFSPVVRVFDTDIVLGQTPFADFRSSAGPFAAKLGAHNYYYSEFHYFGNPGAYLTFVVANNEAGFPGLEHSTFSPTFAENLRLLSDIAPVQSWIPASETRSAFTNGDVLMSDVQLAAQQDFRRSTPINTVGVIGLSFDVSEISSFRVGPNYNQVRVLPRE